LEDDESTFSVAPASISDNSVVGVLDLAFVFGSHFGCLARRTPRRWAG
jgi:hypothetical protein